jgi:VCBS repeat-containing protein
VRQGLSWRPPWRRAIPLVAVALVPIGPATASDHGQRALDGGSCFGRPATVTGTAKADRLGGTAGADVIVAGGGDDKIRGRGGDDLICGGRGRDLLIGGAGDDSLNGGPHKDSCEGGAGADRLVDCELTDSIPASAAPTPNRPPQAGEISASTDERSPVSVDVVAAAADPDGEALTVSDVDGSGTVGDATVDGPHSVRFDPAGRFRSLAPGRRASTSFGYTVADNRGGSAAARVTVTVTGTDDAPFAIGDAAHLDEGASATAIDVLANDTDVDGGPKSIVSTTDGAHGTVLITAEGSGVTYKPDGGYCNDGEAADTFTYTLNGGSAAQVKVTVACNPAPVAVDDAVSLTEGATASAINVLANDISAGGGPKSIVSKTNGAHGPVAITAGGSGLTYTPGSGYCNDGEAADTFTYTLNGGASATVSVSVICVTTVATSPALEPSFDPAITDYTTRCTGTPLEVSGRTAAGATVAIDGAGPDEGAFQATVPLQEGQEFGFSTIDGGEQIDYHVRCLPSDFPIWEYTALKPAAREFYVVTPTLGAGFSPYVVIFRQAWSALVVAL